jgi:hypothetical protein
MAENREHALNFLTLALGARYSLAGTDDELLELVLATLAAVFVNRHGVDLIV